MVMLLTGTPCSTFAMHLRFPGANTEIFAISVIARDWEIAVGLATNVFANETGP